MTHRTLIGPLFALLLGGLSLSLAPVPAVAEGADPAPPHKPAWLVDKEAELASNRIEIVTRVIEAKPADSVSGHYVVTETKEEVPGKWRTIILGDKGRDVYRPPHYRIIRHYAWVETVAAFQGNAASLIVHQPGCRYWDCADCTEHFPDLQSALDLGYRPCGICKPDLSE